jgi:uncharacterized protein (TIGR03000 family)
MMMVRRRFFWAAVPAIALAALLMTVEPSLARGRGGNGGGGGGYGGYSRGYGGYGSYGRGYGGYGSYGRGYGGYGYGWNNPGYGYYGWNRPWYGGYYSGYDYVPQTNDVVPEATYSTAPAEMGAEEYGAVPQAEDNSVAITVHVPKANAQVFFDGDRTQQTGQTREFMSPPLEPNHTYTYTIRAQWEDNGRPMERTKKITVRAGDHPTVDFMRGAATTSEGAIAPTEEGTGTYGTEPNVTPNTPRINENQTPQLNNARTPENNGQGAPHTSNNNNAPRTGSQSNGSNSPPSP